MLSRKVLDTIIDKDADVIALQETKLPSKGPSKKHMELLADYFKGYSYVWRSSQEPARKGYAGTMFLYKDKYSPEVFYPEIGAPDTMDLEGRIMTLDFGEFYLTQVYTPNAGDGLKRLEDRQVWDEKYAQYLQTLDRDKPVLATGDYNVAHKEIDLANPQNLLAGIDHSNLSDVLMLCKANFKTGEIDLISIPRDSRVYVDGKLDKINHSHGKGGIDLTLKTIRDFLGINIDHYVRVDFNAVKNIVDAIDGVDIDVKRDMYYKDTTAGEELFINIKKGQQILNGDKSLEFLRFRSYGDGDEGRVRAQQQFMDEFIKQILQIKNIAKWTDLLETYYGYADTNISYKEVTRGLKMVFKWDKEKIRMLTIPGAGDYVDGISYFIVDKTETEDVISEILGEYLR